MSPGLVDKGHEQPVGHGKAGNQGSSRRQTAATFHARSYASVGRRRIGGPQLFQNVEMSRKLSDLRNDLFQIEKRLRSLAGSVGRKAIHRARLREIRRSADTPRRLLDLVSAACAVTLRNFRR